MYHVLKTPLSPEHLSFRLLKKFYPLLEDADDRFENKFYYDSTLNGNNMVSTG